jgi:hypothetical protein
MVVREGDRLLAWRLLNRVGDGWDAYRAAVLDTSDHLVEDHGADLVAVEDVTHPTGAVRLINVGGLIGTVRVIGWLEAGGTFAVPWELIEPNRHGLSPLAAYPPPLVGGRERVGAGAMRHVRSAWDIAAAGIHAVNMRRRLG